MRNISKEEYYELYWKTYNVNQISKEDKLSLPEIRVLSKLLTHNDGKRDIRYTSPYYGKGRKEIMEAIGMETTTYSNTLAKLRKKEFLIKTQGDDDYALNVALQKLKSDVDSKKIVYIVYGYDIHSNSQQD